MNGAIHKAEQLLAIFQRLYVGNHCLQTLGVHSTQLGFRHILSEAKFPQTPSLERHDHSANPTAMAAWASFSHRNMQLTFHMLGQRRANRFGGVFVPYFFKPLPVS